jgi:hypothetical protein
MGEFRKIPSVEAWGRNKLQGSTALIVLDIKSIIAVHHKPQ